MKKKVLAVLSVSLAMTFLLGACGGSAKPQTEAPASQGTAAGEALKQRLRPEIRLS